MSHRALLQQLRRQIQELAELLTAQRMENRFLEKKILSLQEELEALKMRTMRAEGPSSPSAEKNTDAPIPPPVADQPPGAGKRPRD